MEIIIILATEIERLLDEKLSPIKNDLFEIKSDIKEIKINLASIDNTLDKILNNNNYAKN